jgi:hypothetical protein
LGHASNVGDPPTQSQAEFLVSCRLSGLQGADDETVELYETFKNAILNLGADIEIKPQKMVIGFTVKGKVFADVLVLKTSLKLWINLKLELWMILNICPETCQTSGLGAMETMKSE